ncbi:MAG: PCC domain-containing protein [Halanaerobiales bacterium]
MLDGQVHAHISFADAHNGSQFGGHLEPGCSVLTFCIITIVETGPLGDLDSFEIPEK